MQEVYAALLIHAGGGQITEEKIAEIIKSSGAQPDTNKIKALVASLQGVNIDDAIKQAAVSMAAPAAEEKKEEKKEEESKKPEEAAAGLSALFG